MSFIPTQAVSERLRWLRKQKGWTAEKAGEEMGYSYARIYQVENMKTTFGATLQEAYCRVYGVTKEWLLEGETH